MRNLKLILEYVGSSFFGFQKQPQQPTVQETLEKSLSKILNQKVKIHAASGRTDTGVHAECQVVNVRTSNLISLSQLQKGLNAILPRQIAVKKIEKVHPRFHARYSARSKTYEYKIWNDRVRSPLKGVRAAHVPVKLNVATMRQAVLRLRGRRDFKAFCAANGSVKSTVRRIKSFTVSKKGPMVIFKVEADGFLYHMVRNLVGTVLEVGKGKMTVPAIDKVLRSKDRRNAGPTAPAEGLTLVCVRY